MPDTTIRDAHERPCGTGALEMTYSVPQLHEMTGVPATTIYDAIHAGRLKAHVLPGTGRGWRVKRSEAERFFSGGGEGDD